jgi:arylsulfatase A-like enzyme
MVIRFPGGAGRGRVVDAVARQVDLLPTILDVVGLPIPPGLAGRSLLPAALAAEPEPEPDGTFAYLDRGGRVVEAAIEDGRKLIRFRVEGHAEPAFDVARSRRDARPRRPSRLARHLLALEAAAAGPPAAP